MILTGSGVLASIGVFIWAVHSGQFANQGRARYLALSETDLLFPASKSPKLPGAAYVLLFVLGMGVMVILSPVILTLIRIKG